MAARRYLLLLGSNLAQPERVERALTALAALGELTPLTAIERTPARNHPDRYYYNVLAQLDADADRDTLNARLKQIESDLGRVRDASGVVAIDIDLLATFDAGAWQADPHAIAKREFSQSPACELLREAEIDIVTPTRA